MIEVRNAIITSADISSGNHGILDASLMLDYGGSGQGFGGWALYLPKDFRHASDAPNFAGHFIWRVLEIAGVDEWSRLVGKCVRVRQEHSKVHAIGHIVKDDWFTPEYDFGHMKGEGDVHQRDL